MYLIIFVPNLRGLEPHEVKSHSELVCAAGVSAGVSGESRSGQMNDGFIWTNSG